MAMEIHILNEDKVGLRQPAQLVWTHIGDLTEGDSFFQNKIHSCFLSSGTTSAVFHSCGIFLLAIERLMMCLGQMMSLNHP